MVAINPKPPDPKTFREAVSSKWLEPIDVSFPPSCHNQLSSYKGEPALLLTEDEEELLAQPFKYTLIGKFSKGRPPMAALRKEILGASFTGECYLGLLDYKHVFFKFELEADYHRMRMRQKWVFSGFPARIFKWSKDFNPEVDSSVAPVWVKLPQLPLHLFHKEQLYSIASAVGNPLKMDRATAAASKLLRPSEARICVELDVLKVSGEAEYTDDTPMPPNGLYAALILSKKPHARILSIDDSGAKSSPGFAGSFLAKDIPGDNMIGPVIADEELFASDFVTCVGQVIGVVVADTHENAKLAARRIHIEYEELPAILSIQDAALQCNSFHPNTERCLTKGDVQLCFLSNQCDKIIEGTVQVGGQEHFYLEPNSTLIWTVDNGNEIHMISSTQAGALVQVYTDGTVLVTHGGVEMGQGLHTKVAQIAASSFDIPLSSVFISETSTDKVPNSSPTAASASSHMYGAAVLDACEQITARMKPIKSKCNYSSFKEIEGAFIQGLGWVALEELKWGDAAHKWIPAGCLYTSGPGNYKIPSVNDVPFEFNVSLLKGAPNTKAIHSSKAVGEPPFFLASAVFFAIKDAIISARAEEGYNEWFPLDNPATPERIRMACIDQFTKAFADSHFHPKLSV